MKNKNILIFVTGFVTCLTILYIAFFLINIQSITGLSIISKEFKQSPPENTPLEKIKITAEKITINIPNARISRYANTNSMAPTLGEDSKGIQIVPSKEEEIKLGSIISFKENGKLTVHRVIEIGKDSYGTYYITKGDNSPTKDKKIRFSEIEYLTIGIIW